MAINLPQLPRLLADIAVSQLRDGLVRAALRPFKRNFDSPEYQSYLNTPVYGSFIFGDIQNPSANNYVDQFGVTQEFKPLRFHECTYNISLSKNIITTALQGFNGTVKEYVSDGDLNISIDGRLSGIYDDISDSFRSTTYYPIEYVQKMVAALRVPASIPIANQIVSGVFGVNFVTVTNAEFQRDTAGLNYQKFSIDLISDRPIEIVLSEADLENNQKIADILGI
jgi:hypothetical protein